MGSQRVGHGWATFTSLRSVVSRSLKKRPSHQCFILNSTGIPKVLPGLKAMTTNTKDPPPFCQPSHHGLQVPHPVKKNLTQFINSPLPFQSGSLGLTFARWPEVLFIGICFDVSQSLISCCYFELINGLRHAQALTLHRALLSVSLPLCVL